MRIGQIAPLYESVPPKMYGGTERVVSYLTEELVAQGHDVTLFASGDSQTSARLVSPCEAALRLDPDCRDGLACHFQMIQEVMEQADEFDILHFHVDYLHFPFTKMCGVPHVTTLHGRLDMPELAALYRKFSEVPVVSISMSQREPLSWINWVGNVYHGLPSGTLCPGNGRGGYLAFLGRISREKRVDRAIAIAIEAEMPLKIAAKVDPSDQDYYESEIRHLMEHPLIEYVGEIGEEQKAEFLGQAYAQLFPIDWPEPFGLCMIEALACGTPTIAYRHGSVPEVLKDGVTGFVVENEAEAVKAVHRIGQLSRVNCRKEFEQRFSAAQMADEYLKLYESILSEEALPVRAPKLNSSLAL